MEDEYTKTLSLMLYLKDNCPDCMSGAEFSFEKIGFVIPCEFSQNDVSSIARLMSRHIGLRSDHFIFEIGNVSDSKAGCINLQEWMGFTKITISEELLRFPMSLVMVLAHELTHKFLHEHSVELPVTDENERMTDVASVCLGFGKIILNGKHYCVNTSNGSRLVTIGYLNDIEFALAYDIICYQKAMSEHDVLEGLSGAATKSLWDARLKYRDKYPNSVVLLRTAQVKLDNIGLLITECEQISTVDNCASLKTVANWFDQLKIQLSMVISSDDDTLIGRYEKQVAICENEANNTLASLKHISRTRLCMELLLIGFVLSAVVIGTILLGWQFCNKTEEADRVNIRN